MIHFFKKAEKPSPEKYNLSFFKKKEDFDEFKKNGYIVYDLNYFDFIDEVVIGFNNHIAPFFQDDWPDRLINTGTEKLDNIRFIQNKLIKEQLIPNLNPIFNLKNCIVEPGVFLIKPPSLNSALKIHQDASIIDETTNYGMYCWLPLQDTNIGNGTMHLVPRSHLLMNERRSLNVPWAYEKHSKTIQKYLIPINLKKGQVLIYDNSLIHYSPKNNSDNVRIAISCAILPINYQLIHHFKDEKTPKGKMEAYLVNEQFWIEEDIFSRPSKAYKFLGYFEEHKVPRSKFFMKRVLNKISKLAH